MELSLNYIIVLYLSHLTQLSTKLSVVNPVARLFSKKTRIMQKTKLQDALLNMFSVNFQSVKFWNEACIGIPT